MKNITLAVKFMRTVYVYKSAYNPTDSYVTERTCDEYEISD